ncbi:hypothetical protein EJ065_3086 [Corallococcus coralloides]|uniref:Uncharacterized protein n=1 Tax=Corallococcus coralloides TaxID=184914 RepID=A0A410RRW1_CORCK|nr:hypothetical protein [Corallococcus coralloides]QAT84654.1 hypothetical protein EJ065_3086 [Corallococcus coralloides]
MTELLPKLERYFSPWFIQSILLLLLALWVWGRVKGEIFAFAAWRRIFDRETKRITLLRRLYNLEAFRKEKQLDKVSEELGPLSFEKFHGVAPGAANTPNPKNSTAANPYSASQGYSGHTSMRSDLKVAATFTLGAFTYGGICLFLGYLWTWIERAPAINYSITAAAGWVLGFPLALVYWFLYREFDRRWPNRDDAAAIFTWGAVAGWVFLMISVSIVEGVKKTSPKPPQTQSSVNTLDAGVLPPSHSGQ